MIDSRFKCSKSSSLIKSLSLLFVFFPSLSPSVSEKTACSTTGSWRTTGTCTTLSGPGSCSTWRAPGRCSQRVRTCHRPPSSCLRRTRCRWSASCCTGRRGTGSWTLQTPTTSTCRPRTASTPGRFRRTTPTWMWRWRRRQRLGTMDATSPGRRSWLRPPTTPGTCTLPNEWTTGTRMG